MLLLPFLFPAAGWLTRVSAASNISVDDQNPLFIFSGTWANISGNLDANNGHRMTESPNASATITYTFASVYYVTALWPYKVTSNYAVDGNTPQKIDMQDHSVPDAGGGGATIPAGVVGQWPAPGVKTTNQQHTIHITIPAGDTYGIVDMFIFQVLDASDTSSTTSRSSTTTHTSSSSSSSSSSSAVSPSVSSSTSHSGSSSTEVRNLAISMGIVGTLLGFLLIFLLWRFCIRKNKNKTDADMDRFAPDYHAAQDSNMMITPFTMGPDGQFDGAERNNADAFMTPIMENPVLANRGGNVPLTNVPALMRYGDTSNHYGIQSNDLQRSPNDLNYLSDTLSRNDLSYANQATPSLSPPLPAISRFHPQRRPTMNDSPPMYTRNSATSTMLLGESSTSSYGNSTNEKSGSAYPLIAVNAQLSAAADLKNTGTQIPKEIPGRNEATDSVWDSGYPQPLKFMPIT